MNDNNIHIISVDDSTTNNLLCKILFEDEGYKLTVIVPDNKYSIIVAENERTALFFRVKTSI